MWVVDVQPDTYGNPTPADEGIWRSTTGGASWTEIPDNGITNCGDSAFGPNSGCGVEQGWYNLELAAIPDPPPPIQRERMFTRVRSIFTSARWSPGLRPARKATGSI